MQNKMYPTANLVAAQQYNSGRFNSAHMSWRLADPVPQAKTPQ
jgi:hypothetical protein